MDQGIGAMDPMARRIDNVYPTNPMDQQIGAVDPTTYLAGRKVLWIQLPIGLADRFHESY
jgi:hypothetical protein